MICWKSERCLQPADAPASNHADGLCALPGRENSYPGGPSLHEMV